MLTKNIDLEITDEEFNQVLNKEDFVVVHFFSEWCMKCLMLDPVVNDLAEEIEKAKFAKINIEDNQNLARKFSVSNVPCFVIFKQGKEIERISGNPSVEIIEKRIKECVGC
jgi:thioredoxin 1